MSNPTIPNPGGRPRESERPRVHVSATVAAETDDALNDWLEQLRKVNAKAHIGRVLDRVVAFGKRRKFDVCAEPKKGMQ